MWEDGVPLTSGRSGLASAVIYQPSCAQNYAQECTIAQNPTKREYDDNSGVPPNNNSGSSSMNLNYSSNVYSNLRGSGGSGNRDSIDVDDTTNCDETNDECPKKKIISSNSNINSSNSNPMCIRERCKLRNRQFNDISCNLEKITILRNHMVLQRSASPCTIQRLRRRFQHFIFNHIKHNGEHHADNKRK